MNRPNVLVLCGRARKRSRTAENMYRNSNRFAVRAAGLSPSADRRVTEKDLLWADLIFVMESEQRSKLRTVFAHLQLPPVEVLHIPDDYEQNDPELVQIFADRMKAILDEKWPA